MVIPQEEGKQAHIFSGTVTEILKSLVQRNISIC